MTVPEIREFLRVRGCPETVVAAGAEGLVEEWERVVASVETGYRLGLDDYLNDMDGRELIATLMASIARVLTPAQRRRLDAADARMKTLLVPHGGCLWGERLAAAHGWDPVGHWWYFMRPRKPGSELKQELGRGQS